VAVTNERAAVDFTRESSGSFPYTIHYEGTKKKLKAREKQVDEFNKLGGRILVKVGMLSGLRGIYALTTHIAKDPGWNIGIHE
jgi:hypothetical protein